MLQLMNNLNILRRTQKSKFIILLIFDADYLSNARKKVSTINLLIICYAIFVGQLQKVS